MLNIVVSAYGARNQEFETFIEFSCGLFVGVGRFSRIAESCYVDTMPEKGSPYFWRDVHSILDE